MGRLLESAGKQAQKSRCSITAPENDPLHPAHNAKSASVMIGTHLTTILIQPFDDVMLVTVTQNEKMGTLVSRVLKNSNGKPFGNNPDNFADFCRSG